MALNVAELYRLFLREREFLSNCSPKTIRSYQQAWNAFASFLEPVEAVGCIRPAIKRGVVEKMSTGRLTPGSVNVYLRAINAFLNWGHREEHFVDARSAF